MAAALPESNREVLEDGIDALLADTVAEPEENEEFVDLNEPQDGEPAQPAAQPDPKAKKLKKGEEAPAPADGEEEDVPVELRGKSPKELAKMYRDAQSLIGRQGSELGELRRRADQFVLANLEAQQRQRAAQAAQPAPAAPARDEPFDETQVFAKPKETILKLIENSPVIQEIRKSLGAAAQEAAVARAAAATERFNGAHPDAGTILADPEFQNWVKASAIRSQLLHRAHNNFDFGAGDEVFGTWKALKGIRPGAAPAAAAAAAAATDDATAARQAAQTLAKRKQALRDAATPTSGNAAPNQASGSKKIYRRADVLKLMEEDNDRYQALAPEIELAYAEGRVR